MIYLDLAVRYSWAGIFTRCTNVTKVQVEKVATLSDKLSAKGDYRSLVKVLGLQWKGVDVSDTDGNVRIICGMNLRWTHIQNSHFLGINIRYAYDRYKAQNEMDFSTWHSQIGTLLLPITYAKFLRAWCAVSTTKTWTWPRKSPWGVFLPTSYPSWEILICYRMKMLHIIG